MPLYEYRCRQCERVFDRLERASEPKDGTCPHCGGGATRLLGAPALQFKGSGWYVNDYGKGNGSKSAHTDNPAPAGKASAGDTKVEKKTETKTEKKPAKGSESKVA
jgi:putative FmdB family regulatory protein